MKIPAIIVFLFPLFTTAQDISGVWKGYIRTPASQLEFELAIDGGDKILSGYSLLIYLENGIENIGIKKTKVRRSKREIYFEDGELVYDNFTTQPRRIKMFGNLTLGSKDTLLVLRGNFNTRSIDFRDTRTYTGEVYLEKKSQPLTSKMLVTMDELNYVHGLSFVKIKRPIIRKPPVNKPAKKTEPPLPINKILGPSERKLETVSTIIFNSDSLLLSFYDNGTIDGDTVSMLLDGRMIAEKIKLTANAFRLTIPAKINPGDSLMLIMHAESLGLIPPNTGLLIIQDGNNRHEIRFESDMQKSSAVILRRKQGTF